MNADVVLSALVLTLSTVVCVHAWRRELGAPFRVALLAAPGIVFLTTVFIWAGLQLLAASALASAIVICGLICEVDRRHFIIPNVLVVALLAVAVAAPLTPRDAQVVGAVLTGGIFLAVRLGFRRLRGSDGLGLGDVKLATVMGALLGPTMALAAVAIAAATTAILLAVRKTKQTADGIRGAAPFGVGLSAALAIALVFEAWR